VAYYDILILTITKFLRVYLWLVKAVNSAIEYMPNAEFAIPYEGAKEMLLVDNVDNRDYLAGLFLTMYDELPTLKVKRKN
jgi:hypothetical protein